MPIDRLVRWSLAIAVFGPLLLALTRQLDRDYERRLLQSAGATLGTALDGETVVSAVVSDGEIDADIAHAIASYPEITTLIFRNCRFLEGAFGPLSELDNLGELQCQDCRWDADAGFAEFAGSVTLEKCDLRGCPLDDSDLLRLKNTQLISAAILSCDGVTAPALVRLAASPLLESIQAEGISIDNGTRRAIVDAHPRLQLTLPPHDRTELRPLIDAGAECVLDDRAMLVALHLGTGAIEAMRRDPPDVGELAHLEIRAAEVDDDVLGWIQQARELKLLSLQQSSLLASDLRSLGTLQELEMLNLDGVSLQDDCPLQLPDLPRLKQLHACSSAVSGEALRKLGSAPVEFLSVIAGTSLRADDFSGFTSLQTLVLVDSQVAADSCAAMASLERLHTLVLVHCRVDPAVLESLITKDRRFRLVFRQTDISTSQLEELRRKAPLAMISRFDS